MLPIYLARYSQLNNNTAAACAQRPMVGKSVPPDIWTLPGSGLRFQMNCPILSDHIPGFLSTMYILLQRSSF